MRARVCLFIGLLSAAAAVQGGPVVTAELGAVSRRDALPLAASLAERHGDHSEEDSHEAVNSHSHTHGAEAASPSGSVTDPSSEMSASLGHSHGSGHDDHHSHVAPMTLINETFILLTHAPDPPAYYELQGRAAHSGLLFAHVLACSAAFFGLLPLTMALKMGRSGLAVLTQVAFVVTGALGLVLGAAYAGATPELYAHNKHRAFGLLAGLLLVALAALDFARFVRPGSWLGSVHATVEERAVLYDQLAEHAADEDEAQFVVGSPTEIDDAAHSHSWADIHSHASRGHHLSATQTRNSSISCQSDETMFDPSDPLAQATATVSVQNGSRAARLARALPGILEWALLFVGYSQAITGIAVYYGACRGEYINGCVAHAAKGSVFLWFGLLTWARFLGAFAGLGWAWNRRPQPKADAWSMEFVESLVIFVYGSTNVWLERLGKHGAPWSVKDVQHASIAGMFWGAGAVGMLLESKRVRAWLAQGAVRASGRQLDQLAAPPSYGFSFNPFNAVVIGITGVAMAAHHQAFVFQIAIHALWGNFLGLAAAFRILTYLFLFLRPPASVLPARPPTEALAALCLTAGGVVFVLSTEQVTFAAMRIGFDDAMAFANVTVCVVCAWFVELAVLRAVQGWALERSSAAAGEGVAAASGAEAGSKEMA